MATLTISLAGSAVVTGSKNWTISDADLQKVLDWARTAFPPATLPDDRTNAQILNAWAQSWINGTLDSSNRHYQMIDATTAADQTPPIVIS